MDADRRRLVADMSQAADRLDELAEVAELMDDDAGAARFRQGADDRRRRAMTLLDDETQD